MHVHLNPAAGRGGVGRVLPFFIIALFITYLIMASDTLAGAVTVSQPTGASLAFTSDDPVVVEARAMMEQGHFSDAEHLLKAPGGDQRARQEAVEIIARTRRDYRLSANELLARLHSSIPDATLGELEAWRRAGQVQYRIIDGNVAYFGREPSNVFRFCGDAIRRRKTSDAPADWTLEQHLARVIAEAERTGRRQVVPIRHRVHFSLTVPSTAPGMKRGATVRAWLPFPQEYRQQTHVKLISATPQPTTIAPVAGGEYPLTGAPQRTIYFQQQVDDPAKPVTFSATYEFTSSAWYPILDKSQARPLPADYSQGDLGERLPHIQFTPEIRKIVAEVVGDETNPLERAHRIFLWVTQNIAYNAEAEYCTIPSLSKKAMTSRRGDCGVQTMLFMTLCRCTGIPARWQTGWETKRVGWDMHDWCEIYVEPWGWLPVDASYGLRPSDDPKIREFYFGHQDSYRMIVNRDYGSPLVPPKASLRSEPLDFQRGEVEIDGKNLYFPFWDYDIEIEWLDEGS
ncbi:MAG TPA: transglutaminase domain-containing protein [Tepidisphaeraceae bacterium]|nr:transglutaminase domain-containing protein [Tepidisphaeraceae bacterium]